MQESEGLSPEVKASLRNNEETFRKSAFSGENHILKNRELHIDFKTPAEGLGVNGDEKLGVKLSKIKREYLI